MLHHGKSAQLSNATSLLVSNNPDVALFTPVCAPAVLNVVEFSAILVGSIANDGDCVIYTPTATGNYSVVVKLECITLNPNCERPFISDGILNIDFRILQIEPTKNLGC